MTRPATEPRRPFVSLKIRDRELHRQLKEIAAREGVPLQALVEEALRYYLEDYDTVEGGRSP